MEKPERYITIQTVAQRLSCTDNHVYALIREGKLQAVKIGERALRISERSYDDFVVKNLVDPANYFAPVEARPQSDTPRAPARSAWMRK